MTHASGSEVEVRVGVIATEITLRNYFIFDPSARQRAQLLFLSPLKNSIGISSPNVILVQSCLIQNVFLLPKLDCRLDSIVSILNKLRKTP